MKGRFKWLAAIVVLTGLVLLVGCSKKSTGPVEATDEAAIEAIMKENVPYVTSSVVTSTTPDTSGYAKLLAVDTVKFWWRQFTGAQRAINIQLFPTDSTHQYARAIVTINDTIQGILHVVGRDSLGQRAHDSTIFASVGTRGAYLEKRYSSDVRHRGWVFVSVSGWVSNSISYGTSSVPTTRNIQQVNVQSTRSGVNRNLTSVDITRLVRLDSLIAFNLSDTITVTVTTGDATDSVYLHTGEGIPFWRKPFINNGDGTFTGTWVTTSDITRSFGPKHVVLDVIQHAVIDNNAPYDSKQWGMLYFVRPM